MYKPKKSLFISLQLLSNSWIQFYRLNFRHLRTYIVMIWRHLIICNYVDSKLHQYKFKHFIQVFLVVILHEILICSLNSLAKWICFPKMYRYLNLQTVPIFFLYIYVNIIWLGRRFYKLNGLYKKMMRQLAVLLNFFLLRVLYLDTDPLIF